ncbi:MAG TPA: hypothetical protein VK645_08240 [Chitinophagaceae bacterium]|nr:hypothetical protein [Chitinophagaceae bacterium]
MKNLFLLSFAIFFFACNNVADKTTSLEKSAASLKGKPVETSQRPVKEINSVYKFTGNINNSIPVFIWFVVKDNIIKGELIYLKTKKQLPITLIGTIDEEDCRIHEFQNDGNVTGTYVGNISNKEFKGSWYATASEKELAFKLTAKDTILETVDADFHPSTVTGTYSYQFGKKGPQGGLEVKKINDSLVSLDINCVTRAPAYNIAETKADSIALKNGTSEYKIPDTKCMYRISFFKNFLVINHINKEFDCGFGNNADIQGVFIKTK